MNVRLFIIPYYGIINCYLHLCVYADFFHDLLNTLINDDFKSHHILFVIQHYSNLHVIKNVVDLSDVMFSFHIPPQYNG